MSMEEKGCMNALVGLSIITVAISLSIHSCYNYKRLAMIEKVMNQNQTNDITHLEIEVRDMHQTVCKALNIDWKSSQTDYAGNIME